MENTKLSSQPRWGKPNSRVTSRHFEIIASRQGQNPLVTFRKLASYFNPFKSFGFLPREDWNSLQNGHCVKSFSRQKDTNFQSLAFQMAAGDTTVGSRPTWRRASTFRPLAQVPHSGKARWPAVFVVDCGIPAPADADCQRRLPSPAPAMLPRSDD